MSFAWSATFFARRSGLRPYEGYQRAIPSACPLRRDELRVVVLDRLVAGDIADRSDGRITGLPGALSHSIGSSEDLRGLLVEKQVVVSEVRARDMPTKVLGLEVRTA